MGIIYMRRFLSIYKQPLNIQQRESITQILLVVLMGVTDISPKNILK